MEQWFVSSSGTGTRDSQWSSLALSVFETERQQLPPLVRDPNFQIRAATDLLEGKEPADVFPNASAPQAALAGLWLGAGDWDRAHDLVQDLESFDGYYWHAIVHRQEPAASNSKYWFDKVGRHPIFERLARIGEEQLGFTGEWDPARFVDFCMEAPGTVREMPAREVQKAEWRLLLLHCARPQSARSTTR